MTARPSLQVPPGGDTARRTADKLYIADQWVLQRYTPTSAADATAPDLRFAYDDSYLYVQTGTGQWKRAALTTW